MSQQQSLPRAIDSKHLRKQLILILSITVGFGVAFGRLLLHLGLTSLVTRNAIIFPLTYLIFFVCVYFWRKYADHSKLISPKVQSCDDSTQKLVPLEHDQNKSTWWDLSYFDFGEATLILGLLVVIIWVLVWILGEAPAIMAEAFFDIGLTASLAGALRKRHSSLWYLGLFRKTITAFLAFYIACLLFLLFANNTCPNQTTLTQIVRQCWIR